MGIEVFVAGLLFLGVLGILLVLRPHRSSTPVRRVTSSRNGYGRGWGR